MNWTRRQHNATTAAAHIQRPLARSDELVVEEIDDEVLIYDKRSDQAHCLSATAARVWRACDGTRSAEELGTQVGINAAMVGRALEELEACGLLDTGTKAGVTRREATARLAKVGAAGVAAPLIWSIVGPVPEAAATVTPAFCAQGSGVGTTGCGAACAAFHCCCCCQPTGQLPSLCGPLVSGNQCCYPAATCMATTGYHCSNTAPCP